MYSKKMKLNIHAGHNPDGKVACGASGFVKESTEAREIVDLLIAKLRTLGNTVYNCTVNDGTSQNDVLKKIVAKCNAHPVDLDVSVHLNAATTDSGDGKTKGVEVLVYNENSEALDFARKVAEAISALGFTNRGVKTRPNLYVLKNTNSPAMLIECFFCDDNDDVAIYRRIGAEGIATAIVAGVIGKNLMDVNGDGKVDAGDALEILKQVANLSPQSGGYDAQDALEILKSVAGINADSPGTETTGQNSGNLESGSGAVTGIIIGSGVRIRKGPGTGYAVVGSTTKGQKVAVWKEANGWCMIDNDKWISSQYLKKY